MADEEKIKELGSQFLGIVKTRLGQAGKDFLDDHQDAREFVERKTKRLAELTLELATSDDRDRVRASIDRVQATIDTELLAVANDVAVDAKQTLGDILKTIAEFAKEALPTILAALI